MISTDAGPHGREAIEIAGAGLSGLSAAIAVARQGCRALVHERAGDVGRRFHGDYQGIENWTSPTDVLDELAEVGIATGFPYRPFHEIVCFGPSGRAYRFGSRRPLFYLVRRGSGPDTLDSALKTQALNAGVEIRFGQRTRHLPRGGVSAEGPHRADAIAAGYVFPTTLGDGAYVAVSDWLAPKGYAYLLISAGEATLASCLFTDFHNEREYVERSVAFFREQVGIELRDSVRFGGAGNFLLPRRGEPQSNAVLRAGETAGFQDALFGFGMRYALTSGAVAGRCLARGEPAAGASAARRLRALMASSIVNRVVYERLGDRGYERALRHYHGASGDATRCLEAIYRPRWWKGALAPWLARRRFPGAARVRAGCDCTWCHCRAERAVAPSSVRGR